MNKAKRTVVIAVVGMSLAAWFSLPNGGPVFSGSNANAASQKGKVPNQPEKPKQGSGVREVRLPLGEEKVLKLVPITGNKGPLVSVSPITNEQYYRAVAAKGAPAPILPVELRKTDCAKVAWEAGKYPKNQANNAVLYVNVKDALAYCRWLEMKFPQYHFRLPNFFEEDEIEMDKSRQSFTGRESDSFPRPVQGPDALHIKERFWLAPNTLELVENVELLSENCLERWQALHARLGDGSYTLPPRYRECSTWAPGRATVLPVTFRVVAVEK